MRVYTKLLRRDSLSQNNLVIIGCVDFLFYFKNGGANFGEEFYGESESEKNLFLMSYWAGQRCFERGND